MPFAMYFIFTAWILYWISVCSKFFVKEIKTWIVVLFGMALTNDIIGTWEMAIRAVGNGFSWHGIVGYILLFFLAVHFVLSLLARIKRGIWQIRFYRYSLYVVIFWTVLLISGIPKLKSLL